MRGFFDVDYLNRIPHVWVIHFVHIITIIAMTAHALKISIPWHIGSLLTDCDPWKCEQKQCIPLSIQLKSDLALFKEGISN